LDIANMYSISLDNVILEKKYFVPYLFFRWKEDLFKISVWEKEVNDEQVKITDSIYYNIKEALFSNMKNWREYSIKWHENYEPLMNTLILNRWKIVTYEEFQHIWMTIVEKDRWDTRNISKRLTDTKANLINNICKNLYITPTEQKSIKEFIIVNNGLKIL